MQPIAWFTSRPGKPAAGTILSLISLKIGGMGMFKSTTPARCCFSRTYSGTERVYEPLYGKKHLLTLHYVECKRSFLILYRMGGGG